MKMLRTMALSAVMFSSASLFAAYAVSDRGEWPKDWPKELEPLREKSTTLIGPKQPFHEYAIPFENRAKFEAAWPHLLEVKTSGAPIFLVRPREKGIPAGVYVRSPPKDTTTPEAPTKSDSPIQRWRWTTHIFLVVDGDIVDLNRIPIPPDTPIVDQRFQDRTKK